MTSETADWSDYETGPFCRHWGDPSTCEATCARCGHPCQVHFDNEGGCEKDGCDCEGWTEEPNIQS